MSDVTQGFAPTRAKLYKAPLGTNVSTIVSPFSPLPLAFEDMGALSLADGYSITPGGTPSRTVIREYYDGNVFWVSKTPSDDLPTFDFTALESNRLVLETAFGVTINEDGQFDYFGGIPENACYVIDLADSASNPKVLRYLLPNASGALSGSQTGSDSNALAKWPLQFSPEPSEVLDGAMFRGWAAWLADAS